jgi:hypothetical protein
VRGRTGLVVGLASGLVLGGGAWVAQAAIPDSSGAITACVVKASGQIRLIDTAKVTGCKTGEQVVSWNQQGQPGAPGTNGTDGSNGSDGVSGYQTVTQSGSTTSSSAFTTVTAHCPDGLSPLGGGALAFDDADGSVRSGFKVMGNSPAIGKFGGAFGWVGVFDIDNPDNVNVIMRVTVICADVGA